MTPGERKAFMIGRLRSAEAPDPHREGGYVLRVLSVPGRVTGETRAWPIAVVQARGRLYICGPHREKDWVKNLLAAGWCTVERDDPARHTAVLAEDDDAAEAVAAYLGGRGRPTSRWPFPSDAPPAVIKGYLCQVAVFRLTPPG
jgi:hypothetical protein